MRKMSTKMITEAGVLLALALILHAIKIYQAPYGGSITAGSMVPILLFAIRWGMGPGILVGSIFGVLQLLLGPVPFGGLTFESVILSLFLDYVVAFGFLGVAGLFRKSMKAIFAGIFLGVLGRLVSHYISGVVIWGSFAPEGMNAWLYSLLYNGAYLLPELLISLVLFSLLYWPLKKHLTGQQDSF